MDQKTQKILDQAERQKEERQKAESEWQAARDIKRQLDQAWDQAIRACDLPIPDDAEQKIRTLAALLKKRGWDAWIPSMLETANGGHYLFLGWLQQACSHAPEDAIQESMRAVIPGMFHGQVRGDAGQVQQWFSNRADRNGQPPPVPQPESQPREAAVSPAPRPATLMGVAPRNLWFLKEYEAVGTETYHKPAKIRDKWFGLSDDERRAICAAHAGRVVTVDTVVTGFKRARELRDGKPSKPARKRKSAARKT